MNLTNRMELTELVRLVNAWMMYPIYAADYHYTIGVFIDDLYGLTSAQVLVELGISIDEAISILQEWK